MARIDRKLVKARRREIQENARCEGCGATLAACKAQRGKDPAAPPWFGCCARTLAMIPCNHVIDTRAALALLKEIERGQVRSEDDVLLDSVQEFRPRRWRLPPVCMINDCGCSGEEHA